jgi:hypothetical protein
MLISHYIAFHWFNYFPSSYIESNGRCVRAAINPASCITPNRVGFGTDGCKCVNPSALGGATNDQPCLIVSLSSLHYPIEYVSDVGYS